MNRTVSEVREQPPPADEVSCPACGRRARYKGQRHRAQIFECEAMECPVTIFEQLLPAPELPQRRGGQP
jgi:hypothetical protein